MRGILWCALVASASSAWAGAPIVENFEGGVSGWRVADMVCGGPYLSPAGIYEVDWNESGGNPGAYISRLDPSSNCFYFEASEVFTGDLSGYVGGRLGYSVRTDLDNYDLERGVILIGADNTVLYGELPLPATGIWGRRCLLLNAASFRVGNRSGAIATPAQFQAVMADVAKLYLPAEFGSIVAETVGIDRVELSGACLADVNVSGAVDLGDLNLILANFASTSGLGDLNCDGIVDLADLNAVLAAFGTVCD
ncbi:MAG: laminin B domain-containing protein [Phycisphaerales bacterium JB065]